ncbi:MAG: AraC family transcriptional regulator [Spirochaetia bacterium]|jgi:AraC family transcriptional regulator|nr:AraC family transcriptional regulator [Spirochaetia bacterium]
MKAWIVRLNEAVDYIESHLDGEISYDKAANIAGCSTYHFLRMFAYIADVSLSEYIRRRRLTKAAFDLKEGGKVIDVALRYGYESPTAFNRAFRSIHGIAPSASKHESALLKAYLPIKFTMNIQGAHEMDYRIETRPAFEIVGISFTGKKSSDEFYACIPGFWDTIEENGVLKKLIGLIHEDPTGLLGICRETAEGSAEYDIAVACSGPVPQGLAKMSVPSQTWAIFPGSGPMPQTIHEAYKRIMGEWLPLSGYEFADSLDIERYTAWGEKTNAFEILVPVQKKNKTVF